MNRLTEFSLIALLLLLTGLAISPLYMDPPVVAEDGTLTGWPAAGDIVADELLITYRQTLFPTPHDLPEARNPRIIGKQSRILVQIAPTGSGGAHSLLAYANALRRQKDVAGRRTQLPGTRRRSQRSTLLPRMAPAGHPRRRGLDRRHRQSVNYHSHRRHRSRLRPSRSQRQAPTRLRLRQ